MSEHIHSFIHSFSYCKDLHSQTIHESIYDLGVENTHICLRKILLWVVMEAVCTAEPTIFFFHLFTTLLFHTYILFLPFFSLKFCAMKVNKYITIKSLYIIVYL